MYFGSSDEPQKKPLSYLLKQREAFDLKYQVSYDAPQLKSKMSYASASSREKDPQVMLE